MCPGLKRRPNRNEEAVCPGLKEGRTYLFRGPPCPGPNGGQTYFGDHRALVLTEAEPISGTAVPWS